MISMIQDFSFNFFSDWLPDLMGCLGTTIILVVYALLQAGRLKATSLTYSFLNLGGALLILISLFFSWNLAAVLMEIAWIIISLYGILRELSPKIIDKNINKQTST